MDNHHDLSAHHADGSPPLLMWIYISPRRRHMIVKHEDRSLKAEAVGSKVRLILGLIPNPTQAQLPFTILRNCSYRQDPTPSRVTPFATIYCPKAWGTGPTDSSRMNLNSNVLDVVQFRGPIVTKDRTVFEMWLGL